MEHVLYRCVSAAGSVQRRVGRLLVTQRLSVLTSDLNDDLEKQKWSPPFS